MRPHGREATMGVCRMVLGGVLWAMLAGCVPRPMQVAARYEGRHVEGGSLALSCAQPMHDQIARTLPEVLQSFSTMDTCYFTGVEEAEALCIDSTGKPVGDRLACASALARVDADYLLLLCNPGLHEAWKSIPEPRPVVPSTSATRDTRYLVFRSVSVLWDRRAGAVMASGDIEAVVEVVRGPVIGMHVRHVTRQFASMVLDGTPIGR